MVLILFKTKIFAAPLYSHDGSLRMPSYAIKKGFCAFYLGCMLLGCQNKSTCSKTLSDLSSSALAGSTDFQSNYLMGSIIFPSYPKTTTSGTYSHKTCQALFKMGVNIDRKAQIQIYTSRKCLAPYPDSESSTDNLWVMPFVDSDASAPTDDLKGQGYLSIYAYSQDLQELAKKRSAYLSQSQGSDTDLKAQEQDFAIDMMESLWQATPETAFAHLEKPKQMESEVKDYLRYIHTNICNDDSTDRDDSSKAYKDFEKFLNHIGEEGFNFGFGCYSALDLTMFTATADLSKGQLDRLQNSAKVIPILDQSGASAWHKFLTNERFQRDLDIMSTLANKQQTARKLDSLATDIKGLLAQVPMVTIDQTEEATPHSSLYVASNNMLSVQDDPNAQGYNTFELVGSGDTTDRSHGYLINQTPWGLTALQKDELLLKGEKLTTYTYLYKGALLVAHSVPVGILQTFLTHDNLKCKTNLCLKENTPGIHHLYLTYPADEPEVIADGGKDPLEPPKNPVKVQDTQKGNTDRNQNTENHEIANQKEPPRTQSPPRPPTPPVDESGNGSDENTERVVYNEDLRLRHVNRVSLNTSGSESTEETTDQTSETSEYPPNYPGNNPYTAPTTYSPRSPTSTSNSSDATAEKSDDCTE